MNSSSDIALFATQLLAARPLLLPILPVGLRFAHLGLGRGNSSGRGIASSFASCGLGVCQHCPANRQFRLSLTIVDAEQRIASFTFWPTLTITSTTMPGNGEPIEMFSVSGSTMPAPATVFVKRIHRPAESAAASPASASSTAQILYRKRDQAERDRSVNHFRATCQQFETLRRVSVLFDCI